MPVAHQHDGRRIVKNGRLLLQQLVEQALAPLQFLLGLDALGHILVQPHDADAPPLAIKHRRQRGFVVVGAAVLACDALTASGYHAEVLTISQ